MVNHKGLLLKNVDIIKVRVSDHYNLALAATKTKLVKGNTKTKTYWNYSLFCVDSFKRDMDDDFKINAISEYSHSRILSVLKFFVYTHLPNINVLRFNHNPFSRSSHCKKP